MAAASLAETDTFDKIGTLRYLEDMLMCPAVEAIQYKAQVAHVNRSLPGWYLVDELKEAFVKVGLQAGRALKLARALWLLNEGHGYLPNGYGNYRSYWLVPELIEVYNAVRERLRMLYRLTDWAKRYFSELTWARTWSRVSTENALNEKLTRLSRQLVESKQHLDKVPLDYEVGIKALPEHIKGFEENRSNLKMYNRVIEDFFTDYGVPHLETKTVSELLLNTIDYRGPETDWVNLSQQVFLELGIKELTDENVISVAEAFLAFLQEHRVSEKAVMILQELIYRLRKLQQQ